MLCAFQTKSAPMSPCAQIIHECQTTCDITELFTCQMMMDAMSNKKGDQDDVQHEDDQDDAEHEDDNDEV